VKNKPAAFAQRRDNIQTARFRHNHPSLARRENAYLRKMTYSPKTAFSARQIRFIVSLGFLTQRRGDAGLGF
jgi:hypothetical protein